MLFTNRSEASNSSSSAQVSKKRKIIGGSTSGEASEIPDNLLEANGSQEDSFFIQVTSSISDLCANCSIKFPISDSGHAQTVKEFMSLNKYTGEFTKVSVWKALSVIYQLRIRMYNNIEIATAFCLGEVGNRDLSICTKCAMSLCRLYKYYMEFQDFSSQNSYISKLITDKENNVTYAPPVSPISSVSSPPPITTTLPVLPLQPWTTLTKTVIRRPRLIVSTGNCFQLQPLNLTTNKNEVINSNKRDWSPMSPFPSPPPQISSTTKPPEGIRFPIPVYKCGICTENFHSLDELERHRTQFTSCNLYPQSHKTYICHLCSRDFNDVMTFNQHMTVHYETTHTGMYHRPCVCHHGSRKCPICGQR